MNTFRATNTRAGGITIAWSELVNGIMQVTMIEPFTNKHFEYRSLGDRINDLRQCVNLYPNIPKKKAFANYFSPKVGEYSQIERLYSLDTNSKLHSPLCRADQPSQRIPQDDSVHQNCEWCEQRSKHAHTVAVPRDSRSAGGERHDFLNVHHKEERFPAPTSKSHPDPTWKQHYETHTGGAAIPINNSTFSREKIVFDYGYAENYIQIINGH